MSSCMLPANGWVDSRLGLRRPTRYCQFWRCEEMLGTGLWGEVRLDGVCSQYARRYVTIFLPINRCARERHAQLVL